MKCIKNNALSSALLVVSCLGTTNTYADAVGVTAGQFAVQHGSATYTIPLVSPPGLGEMKPELALSYSSQGGDGPLGKGWTISGLSAISLCPKTIAHDEAYAPLSVVTANADKRFCLDGQRLVKTGGNYGTATLALRTEIDSFSRVVANGWTALTTGPTSFTVKTKSAQTITYGETVESRSVITGSTVAYAWMANRIEDVAGNYISIDYTKPPVLQYTSTAETLVSEIQYTGNSAASAPYASIRFIYSDRPDIGYYGALQQRVERRKRLDRIEMRVQGVVVRSYVMAYQQSARTGASLLKSVQECAGQGLTECLPSTQFEWNEGVITLDRRIPTIPGPWGPSEYRSVGDFNGDGLTDIASRNGANVELKLAQSDGTFKAVTFYAGTIWADAKWVRYGDFDGDGRTDIAMPSGQDVRLKLATNNQFFDRNIAAGVTNWGPSERFFAADVNGDGRQDLVAFVGTTVQVLISNGDSFTRQEWSHPVQAGASWGGEGATYAADFDGDGITDFATVSGGQLWFILTNSKNQSFSWKSGGSITGNERLRWIGDFDGDGYAEFAYYDGNTIQTRRPSGVRINTPSPAYVLGAGAFPNPELTWVGDYNGDGRSDIGTLINGKLTVYESTGLTTMVARNHFSSSPWNLSNTVWSGDFNGDGLTDLISVPATGTSNLFRSTGSIDYPESNFPAAPEAIKKVTAGDGSVVVISYRPATDVEVYTKGPAAAWPDTNIALPLQLVFEVHSSHGVGGPEQTRGTRYTYSNFRTNTAGRGYQGFEIETVRDLFTNEYEITQYETVFPFGGMIKRQNRHLADGTLIGKLENAFSVIIPAVGTRYPYVWVATETSYSESGQPLTETITTQQQPDIYGNFPKIYVLTRDAANPTAIWSMTTTTNQYTNQLATWILGRLTRSDVLHQSSWSLPVTKSAAFEYSPTGVLSAEIVEPDAVGTSRYLRTDYQYDSWGHKTRVSESGYDHQGQALPVRVTRSLHTLQADRLRTEVWNALDHYSRQDMSLVHGGVVESVDANGQTTRAEYDGFGRLKRQVAYSVSGSEIWKQLNYLWATGEAPNAVQKIVAHDSSGGQSVVYQDLLGRTVRKSAVSLDGRSIFEDTRYDILGRVVEATRPSFESYTAPRAYTQYDILGRVSVLDVPGPNGGRAVTHYSYDRHNISITNPLGHVRREVRNALGQTLRIEEGSGSAATDYEYDTLGNLVRTQDAVGQISTLQYDPHGRKIAMVDPAMGSWSYAYNSFGEMESQTDAKLQVTRMVYDKLGRLRERLDHGSLTPVTWTYDTAPHGIGLIVSTQSPDGYQQFTTYNARSLVSHVETTIPESGGASTWTVSTVYDSQNRPWKSTRPGGFVTEHVYNGYGHLSALRSPKETGAELYDEAALLNRLNELIPVVAQLQADALYWQTQANDAFGAALLAEAQAAALSVLPAAVQADVDAQLAVRDFLRSAGNMAMQMADEHRRQAEAYASHAEFYLGLLSDPYYQTTYWSQYLNVQAQWLDGLAQQKLSEAANITISAQIFLDGAVTAQQQADALIAQALAPVQSQISTYNAQAQQQRQAAEQHRLQAEAKRAESARYERQLSMVQQNLSDGDNIVWWRAGTLDAEGRVAVEVFGNGLFTNRDYDPATGQLLSIRTGGINDGIIQDVGYSYDAINNVRSRWDANLDLTADYDYDTLDRLTSAVIRHSDNSLPLNRTLAYSYDAVGNLTNVTENGTPRAYTYITEGAQQRKRMSSLQGLGNLVHDANGNVTASGGRSFTWNTENKPIHLTGNGTTVQYGYSPTGERIRKEEQSPQGNTKTIYAPGGYERSDRQIGLSQQTEHRYYLMAGDQLIGSRVVVESGGVNVRRVEYYHRDALGSIDVVTDSIGRIAKRYHYQPFGQQMDITALGLIDPGILAPGGLQTLLERGFTGHEHIAGLNLIHMNGRVYDTLTARFLSADPFVQAPKSTQGLNRYSYVQNNPLKYTDPSGYFLKSLVSKIKKLWRPIVAIAIAIFAPQLLPFLPLWGAVFAGGFFGGLIMGQGDFKAGLIGGFTALAFYGVGEAFGKAQGLSNQRLLKTLAHGVVGGASSVAQGGKFGHGFLSSGVTQAFAPGIDGLDKGNLGVSPARVVAAAVVGGTASAIGGGKFANGAVTGAFSRAFNDEKHYRETKKNIENFLREEGLNVLYRAASVIGGGGQVAAGGALCASALGCAAGGPLIALGANNIQEGLSGESGFIRQGAIVLAGDSMGNLTIDVANIVSSAAMLRSVVRPDSWKLFRHISSDYVPAYRAASATALSAEISAGAIGAADTLERYYGN